MSHSMMAESKLSSGGSAGWVFCVGSALVAAGGDPGLGGSARVWSGRGGGARGRGEPLFSRAPLGLGLILGPLECDRGGYRVGLRFSLDGFERLRPLGEGQFFDLGDVQIFSDRIELFDDRVVFALSDTAGSGDDGESG